MRKLQSGVLKKISIVWLPKKQKYRILKIMEEYIFSQNSPSVSNKEMGEVQTLPYSPSLLLSRKVSMNSLINLSCLDFWELSLNFLFPIST